MSNSKTQSKDAAKQSLKINVEKLRELTPKQSEGVVGGWSCLRSCRKGSASGGGNFEEQED
jgi:hypothetical protein